MAAYIDLNPVRSGMVENAEDYRWSSYGEALGGGAKGNGKKAREGLMRAIFSDREANQTKGDWEEAHREYRLLMDLALERRAEKSVLGGDGNGGKRENARFCADVALSGAVFHGRGGDWKSEFCERGLCGVTGEIW